jgi:hypothetical protein
LFVALALTLATAISAHAAGAPRIGAFRTLPRLAGPVQTDGSRYGVALLRDGATRIFDTLLGRTRDVPTPSCVNPLAPDRTDRAPRTLVGGGYVVWQCKTFVLGGQLIWMQSLRGGAPFMPAGMAPFWQYEIGHDGADGSTFDLVAAGREWLYLIRTGYHYTQDALVGVHIPRITPGPADDPRVVLALDRRHGTRPLCRGIRRKPGILDAGIQELAYEPLLFDRPFAVNPYVHESRPMQACGGTTAPPLSTPVDVPQAGGGLLTWARDGRVYVRTYRSRATASRRISADGLGFGVAHTRDRLFVGDRVATLAP